MVAAHHTPFLSESCVLNYCHVSQCAIHSISAMSDRGYDKAQDLLYAVISAKEENLKRKYPISCWLFEINPNSSVSSFGQLITMLED